MEPFRLDRQAKAFLAVLIVVALAMVPLAPFLSLVFAGLSLVVLCLVFLIALARNRRPFGPLTRTEGVLALSAAVFAIGGGIVIAYATIMIGAGNALALSHAMLPFSFRADGPIQVGKAARHYSDAKTQRQFKDELARAGIPFGTRMDGDKEFVEWSPEHNEAVEAVHRRVSDGPFPSNRNAHFPDAGLRQEFSAWLTERGVKHETVKRGDEEWIVWEGEENLAHEFMTTRPTKPCKPKCS